MASSDMKSRADELLLWRLNAFEGCMTGKIFKCRNSLYLIDQYDNLKNQCRSLSRYRFSRSRDFLGLWYFPVMISQNNLPEIEIVGPLIDSTLNVLYNLGRGASQASGQLARFRFYLLLNETPIFRGLFPSPTLHRIKWREQSVFATHIDRGTCIYASEKYLMAFPSCREFRTCYDYFYSSRCLQSKRSYYCHLFQCTFKFFEPMEIPFQGSSRSVSRPKTKDETRDPATLLHGQILSEFGIKSERKMLSTHCKVCVAEVD